MIRILFLLALFLSTCQLFSQDTIQLENVVINRNYKKPKVKTIKVGKQCRSNYLVHHLYYNDTIYYLTDSLPSGNIKSVTLKFLDFSLEKTFKNSKGEKISATDFEVTFYEVGDNYNVGKKINNEPFKISFEGAKEAGSFVPETVTLNLENYNFVAQQFYTQISMTSKRDCQDCYYYAPVLYKANDAARYVTKGKPIYKKTQNCEECFGLKMTVKTLTKEY